MDLRRPDIDGYRILARDRPEVTWAAGAAAVRRFTTPRWLRPGADRRRVSAYARGQVAGGCVGGAVDRGRRLVRLRGARRQLLGGTRPRHP